jgi:hypothetical protein
MDGWGQIWRPHCKKRLHGFSFKMLDFYKGACTQSDMEERLPDQTKDILLAIT